MKVTWMAYLTSEQWRPEPTNRIRKKRAWYHLKFTKKTVSAIVIQWCLRTIMLPFPVFLRLWHWILFVMYIGRNSIVFKASINARTEHYSFKFYKHKRNFLFVHKQTQTVHLKKNDELIKNELKGEPVSSRIHVDLLELQQIDRVLIGSHVRDFELQGNRWAEWELLFGITHRQRVRVVLLIICARCRLGGFEGVPVRVQFECDFSWTFAESNNLLWPKNCCGSCRVIDKFFGF